MTVRQILTINDSESEEFLRQPAALVTAFDEELASLVADMIDTMRSDVICVGLAAPQIGVNKQVAIVCLNRDFKNAKVIINPANITESGRKDIKRESCMSLPDCCGNVTRREDFRLNAKTTTGENILYNLHSFEARAVAHEIDHLNGILYSDKVVGELTPFDFDALREKIISQANQPS